MDMHVAVFVRVLCCSACLLSELHTCVAKALLLLFEGACAHWRAHCLFVLQVIDMVKEDVLPRRQQRSERGGVFFFEHVLSLFYIVCLTELSDQGKTPEPANCSSGFLHMVL